MIETENTGNPIKEISQQSFLDKLVWKEDSNNKWYLGKRECLPVEIREEPEQQIITFDMDGYEADYGIVKEGDTVISELGKLKVSKVEENNVYLQIEGAEEPMQVNMDTVKKTLKLNFLILGKTSSHVMENIEIPLYFTIYELKFLLSEYLQISNENMEFYFKDNLLQDERIETMEIQEGDTILLTWKITEEIIYKRSTSKDYSWYDQKNFIPFFVDKSIVVSAFGFFRHTEASITAIYDLFLYEQKEDLSRKLVLSLDNVSVTAPEVDSYYVKKVSFTPIVLKRNVKYFAYVNYKFADMRTYFSYCGTAVQTVSGVTFTFQDQTEPGLKSSSTSGHLPYIYFRSYNPYEN